MQSPISSLPVDNSFHLPLTPPLPPPSAGKRQPPAPPSGFSAFAQLDVLADSGCGRGGMTICSGHTRGHMAGPGHVAARDVLVRRSTAPSQTQTYLSASTASDSTPVSREGPWEARRGSFNSRRSVDPLQLLEDENQILREELAQFKSEAIGSLHRRPMAAIAGGGFRGPSGSTVVTKTCVCDSLRLKLAKIRAELRQVKEQKSQEFSGDFPLDLRDCEVQTSPKQITKALQESAFLQHPMSAPATLTHAVHTLASAVACDRLVHALTQTDALLVTAEVSTQAGYVLRTHEAEVQVQVESERADLSVQAGAGLSPAVDVQTQTRTCRVENASTQAVFSASEVAVQCSPPASPVPMHMASQTDTISCSSAERREMAVQACSQAVPAAIAAVQTDPRSCADAACEASIVIPPKERIMCSAASQTSSLGRSAAAVQTANVQKVAVASQASSPPSPPGIDCSTQAEDTAAVQLDVEREARLKELEARVLALQSENARLADENKDITEKAQAFQHVAQQKTFGQMNVTILCPRAECTVSGDRVELDSWNPERLRAEFEREVLPRFTRVFVEEIPAGTNKQGSQSKVKSEAVDKAMQDFAETFRERLSAMLSAPNAAAAVQAAAASKGIRSSR